MAIVSSDSHEADKWLETAQSCACLTETEMNSLCESVKDILMEESNVQVVHCPVTVCGDVHGQQFDLLELFNIGGKIPDKNQIFIGDFVDRGQNSVETLTLLLCLKLKQPGNLSLLRGNHETRQVTQIQGFYDEVLKKFGNTNVWKFCTDLFDFLNLGAIIEDRILCIHGGLSPEIKTIDQMRVIDRKMEVPQSGAFCDLVWSDPEDIEGWQMSPRGAGQLFGQKVSQEFNHLNDLELIARAHQLVNEGYKFHFAEQSVLTVWSAPNQCYRCGNLAAILEIDESQEKNFKLFREVKDSSTKSIPPKNLVPQFL